MIFDACDQISFVLSMNALLIRKGSILLKDLIMGLDNVV